MTVRTIEAVDPAGVPVLQGENRRVIAVQKFRPQDVGRTAVVQAVASEEDAVLALGIIAEDEIPEGDALPLILKCGDASLMLAPDGSIRVEGSSFGVRTLGSIRLKGATVDLN